VYIPDGKNGWIAIEPSYTNDDIKYRTMEYAWGNKYNSKYDRDVTQYYDQIKNGTFIWRW
jgi:hypothetical protein